MAEFNPGDFCWTDLATTDVAGAKRFYGELFGWTALDVPAGEYGTYTMFQQEGKDVAGMGPLQQEQLEQGVPSYWMPYVKVVDAEKTLEEVATHGGSILMPAMDVMSFGRMAMFQDPTGAVLSLWQPREHQGAGHHNAPYGMCWGELSTRDTETAEKFYAELFGWEARPSQNTEMPYIEWMNDGTPIGGMMSITAEMGAMPPNWGIYIAVDDCDAALERAKNSGGTVTYGPMDIPDTGRIAGICDPQGACFSVIQFLAR